MARKNSAELSPADKIQRSIRRHLMFGTSIVFLLFGVAGGWATMTQISGAVVAPGQLVVDGNVKKVQHPTGGVVSQLLVKDGDHVKAQDILVKLDATAAKSNLAILNNSTDELKLHRERLIAELKGDDTLVFPVAMADRSGEPELQTIFSQETAMLSTRLKSRESQKSQLLERIKQMENEISGAEQQATAKLSEATIVDKQLVTQQKLLNQALAPLQRVEDMQKEVARLKGERGSILANIAQTKGKISETKLQLIQIDQDRMTEVGKELRDTESKLQETEQRAVAALDQLQRIDIRAPQEGIVYQLNVHSPGSVVGAGEVVMLIVPEGDSLSIEAKISPTDIDHVFIGQKANLKFTAFNQRTTPEADGEVSFVSPDLVIDQHSGAGYYSTRIRIVSGAGGLKLLPGMPAEAFIKTGDRSVLSYIAKPLADQIARAFKEG